MGGATGKGGCYGRAGVVMSFGVLSGTTSAGFTKRCRRVGKRTRPGASGVGGCKRPPFPATPPLLTCWAVMKSEMECGKVTRAVPPARSCAITKREDGDGAGRAVSARHGNAAE